VWQAVKRPPRVLRRASIATAVRELHGRLELPAGGRAFACGEGKLAEFGEYPSPHPVARIGQESALEIDPSLVIVVQLHARRAPVRQPQCTFAEHGGARTQIMTWTMWHGLSQNSDVPTVEIGTRRHSQWRRERPTDGWTQEERNRVEGLRGCGASVPLTRERWAGARAGRRPLGVGAGAVVLRRQCAMGATNLERNRTVHQEPDQEGERRLQLDCGRTALRRSGRRRHRAALIHPEPSRAGDRGILYARCPC